MTTYTDWVPRVFDTLRVLERHVDPAVRGEGRSLLAVSTALDLADTAEVMRALVVAVEDLVRLGLVMHPSAQESQVALTRAGEDASAGSFAPHLRLTPELERLLEASARAAVVQRDGYAYNEIVSARTIVEGTGRTFDRDEVEGSLGAMSSAVRLHPTDRDLGIELYFPVFAHFGL